MATISAAATASTFLGTTTLMKAPAAAVSSPILGLPMMGKRGGRVRCSVERAKQSSSSANVGGATSLLAAAAAIMVSGTSSGPAMALVDERMSTEGVGLSLGISNNLLGWILLGVFALIWSLYFVYTSELEEDEESGLSL